jgi:23S rRNA (cytidine1920-2'-O)/16S rRNA (cytidine1409-2'-O)-methyltransferase
VHCTGGDPVCNRDFLWFHAQVATARRVRADLLLVERGLASSRERARALILAGAALADDRPVTKAGELVPTGAILRLRGDPMPFVSRGGVKLRHALDTFAIDPTDLVAVDVGASTGGFSDCLLQAGAARIYAIDVGHGQLAWKVASDARVVAIDRTNIRTMPPDRIPEPCDIGVVDVSFISLRLVLARLPALLRPGAPVVALVKPQFEVGRGNVGKGGIVRDEAARAAALESVKEVARAVGFAVLADTPSPITGADGNVEFLLHLRTPSASLPPR